MSSLIIVAGPPSSGNRVMQALLVRAGAWACEGGAQPAKPADLPDPGDRPFVMVKHYDLQRWIRAGRRKKYAKVIVVIMIREPIATVASMLARGHQADPEVAHYHRERIIDDNLAISRKERARVEIVTYEGLSEQFLKAWLPRVGLANRPGSIEIPNDAEAPREILPQNGKHYHGQPQP